MPQPRAGPEGLTTSEKGNDFAPPPYGGTMSYQKNKESIMKKPIHQLTTRTRFGFGALALAAIAAIGLPQQAAANSTADATILNVATVDFTDASGNNTFTATASATITVNLVPSALGTYLPPAKDTGVPPAAACPSQGTYASGETVSTLYALAAAANGDDLYTLIKTSGADANVNNITKTMQVLDYTGNNPSAIAGTPGTDVTFGSAIPVGVKDASTLYFPGGSIGAADGSGPFAVDDIVLVDIQGTKTAFLVAAIVAGSAASHSNLGDVAHSDEGTTTPEVQAELQLKAYPNQSVVLNGTTFEFGGAITPAFTTPATAPVLASPVGEVKLIHVSVQASVTVNGANGTAKYTLETTDGANAVNIGECTAGVWEGTNLTITKKVKNVTAAGAFGATAGGDPGDVLEYQLTIGNSGALAKAAIVTDDVPEYTTLVPYTVGSGYGGTVGTGAATDIFAQVAAGSNTVSLTVDAADSETNPTVETGFGKTTGIAAGSTMTFYLGDTATNGAGGNIPKLPFCDDYTSLTSGDCGTALANWITAYTLVYRVKID